MAGDTIYMRGGTHSYTYQVALKKAGSAGNYTKIWAYPGEKPVIDFTGIAGNTDGFSIKSNCWYLKGLEIKKAAHNGINISGNSNIVENCTIHDNGNTGLHLTGTPPAGPSYNLITNCDSYYNYDLAGTGGNADGFSAKWTVGVSNVFRACRSYFNSDDGWDLWMASNMVIIDSCIAFSNGISYPTNVMSGNNGNGFKVGGNYIPQHHLVMNCVSFDNAGDTGRGFDENNNTAGQTLYNCTAFRNKGDNYHFANTLVSGQHVIQNCISYQGTVDITSGTQDHDSWLGFTVTNADFLSLDTSLATAPRNADGSLPVNNLFRLSSSSSMIDAGVDVGIPFNGCAPDLGAYETTNNPPVANTDTFFRSNGLGIKIAFADLLTNDYDPDGNAFKLTGINLITTNGIHLTTNATLIFYTNNANVDDGFTYTIADTHCGAATGTVRIVVSTNMLGQPTTVSVSGLTATVGYVGVPGYTYEVQRSTNLTTWVALMTTNAPSAGMFKIVDDFGDLGVRPSQAYYRLRFVGAGAP